MPTRPMSLRAGAFSSRRIRLVPGVWPTLILVACGGGSGTPAPPTDTGTDAPILTDLAVHVVVAERTGTTTPATTFAVRAENAAGTAVEGTTDATGVAHVLVDLAAGSYDVTIAKANFSAVSILGLTGPVTGTVYTVSTVVPTGPTHTLSGAITGKTATADTVFIDAADFLGAGTTSASYAGAFFKGPWPMGEVIATEIDAAGHAVNGVLLKGVTLDATDVTADVAFPTLPLAQTASTLTINLPNAGALTGTTVTHVGESMVLGSWNTQLARRNSVLPFDFVATLAGTSGLDMPVGNKIAWHVQGFVAPLAPDFGHARFDAANVKGEVIARAFTDGLRFEVGQVNDVTAAGASLGELAVTVDVVGYDAAAIQVRAVSGPMFVVWSCIPAAGASMAGRRLPHLPTGVTLADVGAKGPNVLVIAQAFRAVTAGARPYDASYVPEIIVSSITRTVAASGR